jgi:hypothetical protein
MFNVELKEYYKMTANCLTDINLKNIRVLKDSIEITK